MKTPAPAAAPGAVAFAQLDWRGRAVRVEYQWLAPQAGAGAGVVSAAVPASPSKELPTPPLMVFLHEGLGSVAMWRDFPQRLCNALGCRGLVYSRPGYGRSTPRPPDEAWLPDFMHQQALEVLPALLAELNIDTQAQPPWLFGHSDGGSIALLHVAAFPGRVAGLVVLAPHILVEDLSIASIEQARLTWLHTDLKQRLARYHDDPESAFGGWNGVWLSPAFRSWDIRAELATITAPLLAVQGLDDEYGTLAQIHGIAERVPQARLLELPACGHSPHKDQPEAVITAVQRFMAEAESMPQSRPAGRGAG